MESYKIPVNDNNNSANADDVQNNDAAANNANNLENDNDEETVIKLLLPVDHHQPCTPYVSWPGRDEEERSKERPPHDEASDDHEDNEGYDKIGE